MTRRRATDRLGHPLEPKVKRFRKQFKNAKPPKKLKTVDDMLAMFFHKVAQSKEHTRVFLQNGF